MKQIKCFDYCTTHVKQLILQYEQWFGDHIILESYQQSNIVITVLPLACHLLGLSTMTVITIIIDFSLLSP